MSPPNGAWALALTLTLTLGLALPSCAARAPERRGIESSRPSGVTRSVSFDIDWRSGAGPLVVSDETDNPLFTIPDAVAYHSDAAGRIWAARALEGAIVLELFDPAGKSVWHAPLVGASAKPSGLVVYPAEDLIVASWAGDWDPEKRAYVRAFLRLDALTGTGAAHGVSARACPIGRADARGVLWCALPFGVITRLHPSGAELSSTRVGAPRASADEPQSEPFLVPAGDGVVAFTRDGQATIVDADGAVLSSRSLGAPILHVSAGLDGDVVVVHPTRIDRLSSSGVPRWSWRPPSGRVLGASVGVASITGALSTGVDFALPLASSGAPTVTGASPTTRWGYWEDKLPQPQFASQLPRATPRATHRFKAVTTRPPKAFDVGTLISRADGSFLELESSGEIRLIASDGASRASTLPPAPDGRHWSGFSVASLEGTTILTAGAMGTGALDFDTTLELDSFRLDAPPLGAPRVKPLPGLSLQQDASRILATPAFAFGREIWVCYVTTFGGSTCRVRDVGSVDRPTAASERGEDLPFMLQAAQEIPGGLVALAMKRETTNSDSLVATVHQRGADGAWKDLGLLAQASPTRMVAHAADDVWVMTGQWPLSDKRTGRASSGSDTMAALYHWDGNRWTPTPLPMGDVRDFASPAPGKLVVAGLDGVATFADGAWTTLLGAPGGALLVSVSPSGVIGLMTADAVHLGTPSEASDAPDVADDTVRTGRARVADAPVEVRLEPSAWSVTATPIQAPSRALSASGAGPVWAMCGDLLCGRRGGRTTHYLGTPEGFFADLYSPVDADVWLAGGVASEAGHVSEWPQGGGVLAHFDGAAFTRFDVGEGALLAVDGQGADVWAVGLGGAVTRVTNDDVRTFRLPGRPILRDVLVRSPDDVWIVGDQSTVIRWDGARFEQVSAGLPSKLLSLTKVTSVDGALVASGPTRAFVIEPPR